MPAAGAITRNEMLLLSQLGYTLYKEGQYEKAISLFEGLSELQPDVPQFHSVLALLYHLTNDPLEALGKARIAYRLKPSDIPLMLTMGEVYLTLGQPDNAREILNRAYNEARRTKHPALNRIILMLRSAR
jgi:tetratricopeptide (TPR) repeat protein